MAKETIACWNVYFSWNMVERKNGLWRVVPSQKTRAKNVAEIIRAMDSSILGIVECMGPKDLNFFRKEFCPQYDRMLLSTEETSYNLGLLYKRNTFTVKKQTINTNRWSARIGNDPKTRKYGFARKPLVVNVTHNDTGRSVLMAVMHTKSKRPSDKLTGRAREIKNLNNRQRIIAAGLRIRELLFQKITSDSAPADCFLIMGDINDGPDFDEYERKVARSGIESLLGSVLDPQRILYSFVSLADGKGQPSCSFANGRYQLDHIVYTRNMAASQRPKIVRESGKVRSDLVNIKKDGKRRDSDHAPVQVTIDF